MLRRPSVLVVLALTAACGASTPSTSSTRSTPSVVPSAVPSTAPTPGGTPATLSPSARLLAVARSTGALELYGLTGTTAVRVQSLSSPGAAARVVSVSLSGGPAPLLCAVWDLSPGTERPAPDSPLLCYPTGSAAGVEITEAGKNVGVVAVRPDAAALAWCDVADNETLTVATFRQGRTSDLRRYVANTSVPPGSGEKSFTGTGASDLAWSSPTEIVVSTVVESDDGPAPRRFALPASGAGRGWLDAPRVEVPASEKGYHAYDEIVSASGTAALARIRASWMNDPPQPPDRAVRIDLASGAIREVLATAAAGREITHVSGDGRTVVYRTAGPEGGDPALAKDPEPKVYVRYAGDSRGTEISGLPADVSQVVTPS